MPEDPPDSESPRRGRPPSGKVRLSTKVKPETKKTLEKSAEAQDESIGDQIDKLVEGNS